MSKLSYLVTIVRRQQVAQILGFPVYVVTEVAVTPCTAKSAADESIKRTAVLLRKRVSDSKSEAGRSSDDNETEAHDAVLDDIDDDGVPDQGEAGKQRSRVAEDVIRRRGSYGRFAQSWFSQSGWTMDQRRTMGMSIAKASSSSAIADPQAVAPGANLPVTDDSDASAPASALLPKLLRMIQVLFGASRSFYFSYDVDITRSLVQDTLLVRHDTPLHAQVDDNFFWNRNILLPFMVTSQDSLALPLMQGFVGQRIFVVDYQPPQVDQTAAESLELHSLPAPGSRPASFPRGADRDSLGLRPSEKRYLITLISRRSTKRAGLRYLRRGINEEGFTANTVETEQILSSPTWDKSSSTRSFLQVRGSIPLYFSQSAYSLRPTPVLQHSLEINLKACRKHFERLSGAYGLLQIVNLVEKHGIEEPIGTQYQQCVEHLNKEAEDANKIPFAWFDFHHVCRGMKFENVNHLLLELKDQLAALGSTIRHRDEVTQRQRGVVRTNCMDCLDRTNVCQSSFAKHMLDLQLKEDGIDMGAQLDQETAWFNTLWADNGDVVSKQYASTTAMKSDYTRTRKRDYRGVLNDLGLSLARFYNG